MSVYKSRRSQIRPNLLQEGIAIFYDLQKRKITREKEKDTKNLLRCLLLLLLLLHHSPAVIRGGESFEDLLPGSSSLPCLSISPILMRVEEIVEPSSALTSSTVITVTGFTPILARISLRSLPLL
jgi:hypothetical protein